MNDNLFNPNEMPTATTDGLHEKNSNLKSIDEHENRMQEIYSPSGKIGVGIACPQCGNELHDDSGGLVLTTYPPQKRVACSGCGYSTTITC